MIRVDDLVQLAEELRIRGCDACHEILAGPNGSYQEVLEIGRREAVSFIESPPSQEELQRAVAYIRDHWQRRYGLVQVG